MKIIITTEIEIDENGNVEVLNVQQKEAEEVKEETVEKPLSQYACIFDESNPNWNRRPDFNLTFIKWQARYANDVLKCKGYLFLNDVYEMLGMPKTKVGQVVGWVHSEKNPIGDNHVEISTSVNTIDGRDNTIILDFNVDGNIMDICF